MTIIILGFGTIGAISEFNMYQNKEQTNYNELQEKAETAAITLANASWANCNFGTTEIAYSINSTKLNTNVTDSDELKERLGISDLDVQITLSGSAPPNAFPTATVNSNNIVAIDLDVLWCDNTATFSDLNACMTSAASCLPSKVEKRILSIKVGK